MQTRHSSRHSKETASDTASDPASDTARKQQERCTPCAVLGFRVKPYSVSPTLWPGQPADAGQGWEVYGLEGLGFMVGRIRPARLCVRIGSHSHIVGFTQPRVGLNSHRVVFTQPQGRVQQPQIRVHSATG